MHRALVTYASRTEGDDELIQRHSTLIDRIVRRFVSRTGMTSAADDLWSAGALALVEARRRFDPARGATFETFAAHRIRGAMLDELRKMDHLPRRLRSRMDDVDKARSKLKNELGRDASSEELADELDVDLDELAGIEGLTEPHVPLDSVLATLASETSVDDALDRGRMVAAIAAAIEKLPERLQILVSLHYQEGLSYREIAKILDVSEPRVCQLHGDAMRQLRGHLEQAGPVKRKAPTKEPRA